LPPGHKGRRFHSLPEVVMAKKKAAKKAAKKAPAKKKMTKKGK
jgi:hypothetical protein